MRKKTRPTVGTNRILELDWLLAYESRYTTLGEDGLRVRAEGEWAEQPAVLRPLAPRLGRTVEGAEAEVLERDGLERN